MPKEKIVDLLYALMKDSKRSDRELAKIVKVSQPTVTRMRKILEEQGYIREYTVIPSLEKLGFEILALTFISANLTDDLREWISKNSKILFSCFGEGLTERLCCWFQFTKTLQNIQNLQMRLGGFSAQTLHLSRFSCPL
jgi:DNA-binding Lrp family transcriptional regulator